MKKLSMNVYHSSLLLTIKDREVSENLRGCEVVKQQICEISILQMDPVLLLGCKY